MLSIVLILAVVFSSFEGYHYFSLLKENAELVAEHSILRREFSDLNEAYLELKAKHEALVGSFSKLREELLELNISLEALNRRYLELLVNYTDLSNNYNSLSRSYQELLGRYEEMRDDYGRILRAFNEPLPYKLKPTISELSYWLKYEDNTDKIAYEDPNFVCGDFAVMLSQHAKLKNWDMGIVLVSGHDSKNHRFNHVFNAILCREGIVYVEPQTDDVFWYGNHERIVEGLWYEFPGYGLIYVEIYIEVVLYE